MIDPGFVLALLLLGLFGALLLLALWLPYAAYSDFATSVWRWSRMKSMSSPSSCVRKATGVP